MNKNEQCTQSQSWDDDYAGILAKWASKWIWLVFMVAALSTLAWFDSVNITCIGFAGIDCSITPIAEDSVRLFWQTITAWIVYFWLLFMD